MIGISIHAPLAGRDAPHSLRQPVHIISIHAPLAGRDQTGVIHIYGYGISIHAPLAGRDVDLQEVEYLHW